MRGISNRLIVLSGIFFCLMAAIVSLLWAFWETPAEIHARQSEEISETRRSIASEIAPHLEKNELVPQINVDWKGAQKTVQLEYTIDQGLQLQADKLLKQYKPDYAAIVVMDAETGRVLAMSSFTKDHGLEENLTLRSTFPAASIFKIVTATAALDKYKLTPETKIQFNGSNHTLYRRNVMATTVNRWTRAMSLRQAFAQSVNTVFGRLALERLQPQDLREYASRFGFNRNIASDLPFAPGAIDVPDEKNFHLTEISSGFNTATTMSPMQGAMIAASVITDGEMPVPYIVERVKDEYGQILFQAEPVSAGSTMSAEAARRLQVLMEATISQGTSRKSFRYLTRNKRFKELIVGGKTGSLTGTNPRGKTDWFVGYGMNENQKIAVAAVTVNVKYWTVKSSYLAQAMLQNHFRDQFSPENAKFFNASSAEQ